MATGKAAKQKRNLQAIIIPKLERKLKTTEYQKEFKRIVNSKTDKYTPKDSKDGIEIDNKFKMYVYNHALLNGEELTKKQWLEWIKIHEK